MAAVPSYHRAHKRIVEERGPARQHRCADCGAQAREWSYDKGDPDELVDWVKSKGRMFEVRYSPDTGFYSPRCKSCHTIFDKNVTA